MPPPPAPPCKPFSSFSSSNFEFQCKNPTSFPVKVGTQRERERERERERGRILCPLDGERGEKAPPWVSGGVPPEKLSPAGVEEGGCSARRGSGGSEPRALYAGSGAWKCRT